MEDSRKKLRVCLFFVVLFAILVGCIYYFSDVKNIGEIEDGVLVKYTEYTEHAMERMAV